MQVKLNGGFVTIGQNSTKFFGKDMTMEMKLPRVERIVTETIDGKQVQKQIYADGSYGVRDGDSVERYFPDGKRQTYIKSADSFRLSKEVLPGGTKTYYNDQGKVNYHATKGVEDTVLYLAKKHVAKRRLEKEDKLSKGKDERVILPKMYYKFEKAIKMKKAVRKVKKDFER